MFCHQSPLRYGFSTSGQWIITKASCDKHHRQPGSIAQQNHSQPAAPLQAKTPEEIKTAPHFTFLNRFSTMPAHLLDSVLCAIRLPLSLRANPACRFAPFTSTQWQEQNSTLSPTAKTIRRRPPRALDASVACVTQSIWSLLLVSVCDTTTTTTTPSHPPLLLHMSAVAKQAG